MKDFINKNDYYGQIKMWKSSRKSNSVAVVVESKSDEKLFRSLFHKDTTFFSVSGFQNVLDTLTKLENDNFYFVIGIIDADFRRINNETVKIKNIFLTDCHDLEMMMVKSDAWDNSILKLTEKEKIDSFENKHGSILDFLLNLSKHVASVRFLNYRNNLELKFKNVDKKGNCDFIDYNKFIDINTLSIDKDKMLETIENKSQKNQFFKNNQNLKQEFESILQDNYDLYEFCNGHDFMNILSLALKKALSNEQKSGKDLEEILLFAYRLEDFIKTNLYKLLKEWNEQNTVLNLIKIDR